MDKERFNRYCAEVRGYRMCADMKTAITNSNLRIAYNPHDDLNQSVPVANELAKKLNRNLLLSVDGGDFQSQINGFIVSTMSSDNETVLENGNG